MKFTKRILAMTVALVTLASLTTAYATETKTFDGYEGTEGDAQISISNIIGVDSYLNRPDEYMEGYTCQAPVTISVITDEIELFEAIQIVPINNELYYASYQPAISGMVREYENNTVIPYSPELEPMSYSYQKGCSMTITKPGMYHVLARFGAIAGGVSVCLNVVGDVAPTASKIYVDGKEMEFEAYNIDDNNHFKLRDIAKAISGSAKQFEVEWNQEKGAINLISNKPYTEVGGEMVLGDQTVKKAQQTKSTIYVNGQDFGFTAYTINDNNYFELRDLGLIFNFDVSWDAETNSILIETDKDYTDD